VAEALARRLGGEFFDADAYHPPANVDKMAAGVPLTDADRAGWLATLAGLLTDRCRPDQVTVLACSALKESYRQVLRVSAQVRFLYLQGSPEVIEARLRSRAGHFMKPGMLASQLATLEEPACGPGTDAWCADLTLPVEAIVDQALVPGILW
jgi:gluconokinase